MVKFKVILYHFMQEGVHKGKEMKTLTPMALYAKQINNCSEDSGIFRTLYKRQFDNREFHFDKDDSD